MKQKRNVEERNLRKKMMLAALKANQGLVTYAAAEIGIIPRTHRNWMKEDPEYKEAVQEIIEEFIDMVEKKLYEHIEVGSEKSLHFYLRTKAKHRGYGESVDVTSKGESIKIDYITPEFIDITNQPKLTDNED